MAINSLIISKYLTNILSKTFFYIFFSLVAIIFINHLFLVLKESIHTPFLHSEIFYLILFKLISDLPLLIPFCLFFAILISTIKLSKNSETYILLSSGQSKLDIFKYVSYFLFFVFLFSILLSFVIAPFSNNMVENYRKAAQSNLSRINLIESYFNVFDEGTYTIFADNISNVNTSNEQILEDVFLFIDKEKDKNVVVSDSGKKLVFPGSMGFQLKNGTQYSFDEKFNPITIQKFDNLNLLINTKESKELDLFVDILQPNDANLFWRLSIPLSLIPVAILGLISFGVSSRGSYIKNHMLSVLFFFFYIILILFFQSNIEDSIYELLPSIIGAHLPAIILIIIFYLKYKKQKNFKNEK